MRQRDKEQGATGSLAGCHGLGRIFCVVQAMCLAPVLYACNEQNVVQLTVSDHNLSGSQSAAALDYWVEQVTEACGGKLELNVLHGAELLTSEQVYSGVESGIADIAFYVLNSEDGFALNTVMSLPFMEWSDGLAADEIYQDLFDEFSQMRDEWRGVTIIGMHMMLGTHMHFADAEATAPGDLEGLRIMAAQQMTVDTVRAAGAIPVKMDIGEVNAALKNGKIGGMLTDFSTLDGFNILDQLNHHVMFGDNGINMTPMFVVMNSDVLEHLDGDVRSVLLNSGTKWKEKIIALDEAADEAARQKAEDAGHVFTELTEEEIDAWKAVVMPAVHSTWIAASVAKGLPAQEIYDKVTSRLSKR